MIYKDGQVMKYYHSYIFGPVGKCLKGYINPWGKGITIVLLFMLINPSGNVFLQSTVSASCIKFSSGSNDTIAK